MVEGIDQQWLVMPIAVREVRSTACSSRIPMCNEFLARIVTNFAGSELFAQLHDDQPGTFYLTDFLAKHFVALVWEGLGLDRHPQLRDTYFSNYTRVVLLSQTTDPKVVECAKAAAVQLGLSFEHRHVGVQGLANSIPVAFISPEK